MFTLAATAGSAKLLLPMHGHLPFLISRVAPVFRHVGHLYHNATRVIELGLYSLQMPKGESERRRRIRHDRSSLLRRRGKSPAHRAEPFLIHYHIFKNAGTSFEWALRQTLGSGAQHYDAQTSDGVLAPEEIADYAAQMPKARAVFSHHAVLPPPRIRARAVVSSILIRDPIARIRSIYAFERRQRHQSPGAIKAKELDFKAYVEWRLACSPAMFCNYQVYFCSRTKANKNEERTTEAHLQHAISNLDLIDIVGTVERYNEWVALAQSILSEFFPNLSLVVARQNASSAIANVSPANILEDLLRDLGPELAARLLECNELDMRFHQVADALLTRRLAEERVDIALLKSYADASMRVRPEFNCKEESDADSHRHDQGSATGVRS